MKIYKLLCLFALVVWCGALWSGITGCATSTTGKLTQTEGVVISTVNAAMATWKQYVLAGKATQSQMDTVQSAYNVYYSAQLHAEAALLAQAGGTNSVDPTVAQNAANAAEASLVNLVTQYTK